MIRAFNKHYRKAIDLIESSSTSEKMEIAEKVIEWFRELPEEYIISLAMFFNEVIDDLGDDSLEKINLDMLVKVTEGFNGAEIEQSVNGAMIEAFNSGRPINEQDLVISAGNIVPLSTTMREEIGRMERWAYNRAVPASKQKFQNSKPSTK